jgi:hypothetical protein
MQQEEKLEIIKINAKIPAVTQTTSQKVFLRECNALFLKV